MMLLSMSKPALVLQFLNLKTGCLFRISFFVKCFSDHQAWKEEMGRLPCQNVNAMCVKQSGMKSGAIPTAVNRTSKGMGRQGRGLNAWYLSRIKAEKDHIVTQCLETRKAEVEMS